MIITVCFTCDLDRIGFMVNKTMKTTVGSRQLAASDGATAGIIHDFSLTVGLKRTSVASLSTLA